MIPPEWDNDEECYGASSTQADIREQHEGHKTHRDCYRAIWKEPPLPWFKIDRAPRTRAWHLAVGIRLDSGEAQTKCNIGHGRGPFLWREAPALSRHEEPDQWFCRRCVAEWTRRIQDGNGENRSADDEVGVHGAVEEGRPDRRDKGRNPHDLGRG